MSDQDSDLSQESSHQQDTREIDATAFSLLAMLHLNSTTTLNAGNHQPPTNTTATPLSSTTSSMDNQCTKFGSTKRQSPSSLFSLQEPSSKRATLLPPSSSTTTFSGDHRILGFTKLKLPLPSMFSSASSPSSSSSTALRRTISDPINSPGCDQLQAPPNTHGNFFSHQLPENSAVNSAFTSPSQPLYRSISDPTSASYQVVTTTSTPPRPPAARKVMRSTKSIAQAGQNLKEESPNTKRLKRMKDRLREMSQWWNEVIKEDEEDSGSEDNDSLSKDESEVSQVIESEGPCEEAVWVERNGECLILHFKCPCGKGYQILLMGKTCYYKLTAF